MKLIKRNSRSKYDKKEIKLPKKCRFLADTDTQFSAINEYENNQGKTLLRVEFQTKVVRSLVERSAQYDRLLNDIDRLKAENARLKDDVAEARANHQKMAELVVKYNEEYLKTQRPEKQNKEQSPFKDSTARLAEAGTKVRSPALQGGHPGHGKRS